MNYAKYTPSLSKKSARLAALFIFPVCFLVIVQLLEEHTSSTTIKIPKQYRVEEVLREELKR